MDNVPANLRFYEFDQNNSGGSFDTNHAKGIGQRVWIQATSADHANDVAEKIGLYFDGCTDGKDCNCCGDRWSRVDEHDAVENIPVNDMDFYWGCVIYVHLLDGTIETLTKDQFATFSR